MERVQIGSRGNHNFDGFYSGNGFMDYVEPHPQYRSPSGKVIAEKYKEYNIPSSLFSVQQISNVADIFSHKAFGGHLKDAFFNTPTQGTLSSILSDTEVKVYGHERHKALDKTLCGRIASAFPYSSIPGDSPLDKAFGAHLLLAKWYDNNQRLDEHKQEEKNAKQNQEQNQSKKGQAKKRQNLVKSILSKSSSLDSRIESIKKEAEKRKQKSKVEKQSQEKKQDQEKDKTSNKTGPFKNIYDLAWLDKPDDTYARAFYEDTILEHISLLKSRKKIKAKDKEPEYKVEQMTRFSQLAKPQSFASLALPTFQYKAATKQLNIRKRQDKGEQHLILMLDVSGSMNYLWKIQWVEAVLRNRLQAVIEGKAKFYIVPFLRFAFVNNIIKVETKQEAQEFLEHMKNHTLDIFKGGQTNIERSIKEVEQEIKKGTFGNSQKDDYQILILNDGQDHINHSFKPKHPTHGFILETKNRALKNVIKQSGGHYEEIEFDPLVEQETSEYRASIAEHYNKKYEGMSFDEDDFF